MGTRPDHAARDRRPGEPERRAGEGRTEERVPPVEELLALQRTAGNQAVSALLARSPEGAVPTDEKGAKAAGRRATLPGIGTIPLLSVNLDPNRVGGAGGGRGGSVGREETRLPSELVVSSKVGKHTAALSKALLDGKAMDVEIVMPSDKAVVRLSLKGALVSSYSVSGETESWALTFSSISFSVDRKPGEPDSSGDDAGYDTTPARP